MDAAAAIEADGRPLDAIDLLTDANRARPDGDIERELVRLRHVAFDHLDRSGSAVSPPVAEQFAPIESVPPMVSSDELTPAVLRSGILSHGSLLVRGAVGEPRVRELIDGIDHAIEDAENHRARLDAGTLSPWFEPFRASDTYPAEMRHKVAQGRKWVRMADGVWGADSPRMMFNLLETLDEAGLGEVVTGYLGERPAMTVDKCTLRRVGTRPSTDWHQDGSFLGSGIRTVNVWLCLSECGRDAPGLDVVPNASITSWRRAPKARSSTGPSVPVSSSGSPHRRRSCGPSTSPATCSSSTNSSSIAPRPSRR